MLRRRVKEEYFLLRGTEQQIPVLRRGSARLQALGCRSHGRHMAAVRAAAAAKDADPGLGHGFHAAGEALRRAVVHRLAIHDLRDAGIGLGDQGHTGNFMQPLQLHQHLLRANGAVQAKGVGPHTLHHL